MLASFHLVPRDRLGALLDAAQPVRSTVREKVLFFSRTRVVETLPLWDWLAANARELEDIVRSGLAVLGQQVLADALGREIEIVRPPHVRPSTSALRAYAQGERVRAAASRGAAQYRQRHACPGGVRAQGKRRSCAQYECRPGGSRNTRARNRRANVPVIALSVRPPCYLD
jgi:hypothetical protein